VKKPRYPSLIRCDEAFARVPEYADLSFQRRARLCLLLGRARDAFDVHRALHELKPSASAGELSRIIKSLEILAEFGQAAFGVYNPDNSPENNPRPTAIAAVEVLVKSADRWAENASQGALPGLFQPSPIADDEGGAMDYGSWPGIRAFFDNATSILAFANAALAALSTTPASHDSNVKNALTGVDLPHNYEEIFKRKYGASVDSDTGFIGPGIMFVQAALEAMQIPSSYAPRAIKDHWITARKRTDRCFANSEK
jgi:hypothetical protein